MTFFKYLTCLILLILICTSCEKEIIVQGPDQDELLILDYLEDLDYDLESIEFKDGFVVYQNDAGWSKADLLIGIKNGETIPELDDPDADDFIAATERQRGISSRTHVISKQNVEDITYYIRGSVTSDLNTAWRNAIVDAAEEWTNLSYCRINLTRVYSPAAADIIIGSDNDQSLPDEFLNLTDGEVIALGNYPYNGSPGRHISINDYYVNLSYKMEVMMHEFGHTLGFRHTNSDDGIHIHGTPTADGESVMHSTAGYFELPLEFGDQRMARIFYPENLNRPVGFSASRRSSSTVRIGYFNTSYFSKPYYWVRVAKYNTSGQILATRYFRSLTTFPHGFHMLDWGGHQPGTYLFAVRGCNYKRDVWSLRTQQISVNL